MTPESSGGWAARLQVINKTHLYLTLFAVISLSVVISHHFAIRLPSVPADCTKDAYILLRNIPADQTVVIDTGVTNAARGESGSQLEAALRLLMRDNVKIVLYTWVEPQCILIAQEAIDKINDERRHETPPEREYREWDDYVILGFFPDGGTMLQTAASNLHDAWGSRDAKDPTGRDRPVFDSPVLKNVHRVQDLKAYLAVSPTAIMPTIVARVGRQVPVVALSLGVMFPEHYNYYKSGQLKGLLNGLVGTIEFESLMEKGIDADGVVGGHAPGKPLAAGFPGRTNYGRASDYYFAFSCGIILLLMTIVVGNVAMFIGRKGPRA